MRTNDPRARRGRKRIGGLSARARDERHPRTRALPADAPAPAGGVTETASPAIEEMTAALPAAENDAAAVQTPADSSPAPEDRQLTEPAKETPPAAPEAEKEPAPAEKAVVYQTARANRGRPTRPPAKERPRARLHLPRFMQRKPGAGRRRPPLPLVAGLALIVLLGASAFVVPPLLHDQDAVAYAQAWEVSMGDRVLAVVADREEARSVVEDVIADKRDEYDAPVEPRQEVTYQPVEVEADYLGSMDQLRQAVDRNVTVRVEAWVITVDGRALATLKTEAEAYAVLMDVLAPYQQLDDGTVLSASEMGFAQDVAVVPQYVEPGTLISREDAVALLSAGADAQQSTYTVAEGDTLSKIAGQFGLTVEDLQAMNEEIADTDVIQVGQTLYVAIPQQVLNVRCTLTRTREEAIPFTTRTEKVDTMYADQQKVLTEGRDGARQLTEQFTYMNGVLVSTETLNETVLREPVEKVVQKGTKTRPGSAVNTAGRWDLPLKAGTYRISSYFGMRNLNGVKRMHKGVDLAAPAGTPIYASRAGTVSFAGNASGYGLVVYIDHGNGIQTRYGHCSKLLVSAGEHVKKGQLIAKVGSTGRSTGPHCHFEVRINGVAVDPLG